MDYLVFFLSFSSTAKDRGK